MTSVQKSEAVMKDSDRQREHEQEYKTQVREDIWSDIKEGRGMYDIESIQPLEPGRNIELYGENLTSLIIEINGEVENFKRVADVGKSNVVLKACKDTLKELRRQELMCLFRGQLCTKNGM